MLLLATAAALGWANSPWSDAYVDFWHTYISFDIHIFAISEDLGHLVNDGLMAVFFFVVGLEIKRELLHGELSSVRKAALPVVAAVGGMATPALIYVLFNASGGDLIGWGVPMATDIAFALGVLALLGRRVPAELRVFLLGLAVVDDLGAIAIIATFYTDMIDWTNLGLGLALFAVMAGCMRMGIRSLGFYLILCVVMWQFFLESGIHATLMGVMVAAIIPTEPYLHRRDYASAVEDLLHDYRLAMANNDEEKAQAVLEQIERLSRGTEGPMERLERIVHPVGQLRGAAPVRAGQRRHRLHVGHAVGGRLQPGHAGRGGRAPHRQPGGRSGHDVAGRPAGHRAAPIGGCMAARAGGRVPGGHRLHRRHLRVRHRLRRPRRRRPGEDGRVRSVPRGGGHGLPLPAPHRPDVAAADRAICIALNCVARFSPLPPCLGRRGADSGVDPRRNRGSLELHPLSDPLSGGPAWDCVAVAGLSRRSQIGDKPRGGGVQNNSWGIADREMGRKRGGVKQTGHAPLPGSPFESLRVSEPTG